MVKTTSSMENDGFYVISPKRVLGKKLTVIHGNSSVIDKERSIDTSTDLLSTSSDNREVSGDNKVQDHSVDVNEEIDTTSNVISSHTEIKDSNKELSINKVVDESPDIKHIDVSPTKLSLLKKLNRNISDQPIILERSKKSVNKPKRESLTPQPLSPSPSKGENRESSLSIDIQPNKIINELQSSRKRQIITHESPNKDFQSTKNYKSPSTQVSPLSVKNLESPRSRKKQVFKTMSNVVIPTASPTRKLVVLDKMLKKMESNLSSNSEIIPVKKIKRTYDSEDDQLDDSDVEKQHVAVHRNTPTYKSPSRYASRQLEVYDKPPTHMQDGSPNRSHNPSPKHLIGRDSDEYDTESTTTPRDTNKLSDRSHNKSSNKSSRSSSRSSEASFRTINPDKELLEDDHIYDTPKRSAPSYQSDSESSDSDDESKPTPKSKITVDERWQMLKVKAKMLKERRPDVVLKLNSKQQSIELGEKLYQNALKEAIFHQDNNKAFMLLFSFFLVEEYILVNLLGWHWCSGISTMHMQHAHEYEVLLLELGEKSYMATNVNEAVERRLMKLCLRQTLFFILAKKVLTNDMLDKAMSFVNTLIRNGGFKPQFQPNTNTDTSSVPSYNSQTSQPLSGGLGGILSSLLGGGGGAGILSSLLGGGAGGGLGGILNSLFNSNVRDGPTATDDVPVFTRTNSNPNVNITEPSFK
jgi:hypothetical protein